MSYCCTLQNDLNSSIFSRYIVLLGIGSSILAGVLYIYLSRRGGGDADVMQLPNGIDNGSHDNITIVASGQSHVNTQLFDASSATSRNSIEGGNFDTGWKDHSITSFFAKVINVLQKVISFPSLLMGTARNSITNIVAFPAYALEKCSSSWEWLYRLIVDIPSQIGSSAVTIVCSASKTASSKVSALLFSCQSSILAAVHAIIVHVKAGSTYVTVSWSQVVTVISECISRLGNTNPSSQV